MSVWGVVAFWGLAAVTLLSALLVVYLRNLVYSVLWLAVTFLGIAGLYLLLEADFLAFVQVLIYAGAVCIMVIFAVMLTQQGGMGRTSLFNYRNVQVAGPVVLAVFAVMAGLAGVLDRYAVSTVPVPPDTVGGLAVMLLSKYVVAFEVAAVLLLVALVGAIVLAREVKPGE